MKLPDMPHAYLVRRPHAHARILSVAASVARAQPGVIAVFTTEDTKGVIKSEMNADAKLEIACPITIPKATSRTSFSFKKLKNPLERTHLNLSS